MKTLISGASGLVGSALVEHLFAKGHTIRCLQRHKQPVEGRIWDIARLYAAPVETPPFDVIIHLAGENVADGRWTSAKKERILTSRVAGSRQLVDFLTSLDEASRPATLMCASAIGFYGNGGEALFTENSPGGSGFLAEVCKQWENEAARAAAYGIRVVHLRFGMILSPKGGALHKMLPPFKAGLGGIIGNGRQYMSWISIRDLSDIVDFVIRTEAIRGPVNVVAPEAITNRDFTKVLGQIVNRPTMLPAPAFLLRLIFGEMADEMLLTSSKVSPVKLMHSGYRFQDSDLQNTLAWCVHPERSGQD
jgi:uncharacterized protein